jgi:DEAD/DEAH box helicase domain-containing protein
VAPLYIMCDSIDMGVTVDPSCLGRDALFIYDRYAGGMGYAERAMDHIEALFGAALEVLRNCSCDNGCPSCVGSAMPAFATADMDSAARGRILDKAASLRLLQEWLDG